MYFKSLKWRGGNQSKITAATQRAIRLPIEPLERRVMLASTASWISPYLGTGTTWTYQETDSSNNTTIFNYTNKGPATAPGGQSAFELDVTSNAGAGMFQGYYGTDSAGDLVEYYGNTTVANGNTSADTYTPYDVDLPATLIAGQTVTTTDQDVNTSNNSAGSSTDTSTVTKQFTLASETPTPITIPNLGTYNSYEVTIVETDASNDGGTTTPDTTQTYFAPNVGVVKSVDTDGTVGQLTAFTAGYHLAVTQPENTLFDDPINPAIQVSIQNSSGALDTSSADQVTLTASISSASTGAGTLNGSSTATTVGGVATFSDLSITKPGQYILAFTDSTGRSVQTQPFQITAGKLVFKRRVSNGVAGSSLDPAVEVELVNNKKQIITDADNAVTISIGSGDPTCPLTNNVVQLVHGIALFPALKLGKPGNYTLSANDANDDTKATSNEIEITGLHIAFAKGGEIKEAGAGVPLVYRVELEDSRNRLVNNSSLGLQLTLTPYNDASGVLSGIADVFSFGVADNTTSPRVAIDQPGSYTLTFTVLSEGTNPLPYQIDPLTTEVFRVLSNHLDFVRQPATTGPNLPLKYDIEVRDYQNKVVNTNSGDTLSLSLIKDTSLLGPAGTLAGNTDTVVGGDAQNSSGMISITAAGTYQLAVTDIPSGNNTKAAGVTSKPFRIKSLT